MSANLAEPMILSDDLKVAGDTRWVRRNELTLPITGGPGGGAPTTAQYLTLALDATLTAERVFTPGLLLAATDGGPNGNYTLNVDNTKLAITAGKLDKTGVGTLTLDASGAFTLTVPASGTVPLGTGANTWIAVWSGVNTLSGSAALLYNGSEVITTGNIRISNNGPILFFEELGTAITWDMAVGGDQVLIQRSGVDQFIIQNSGRVLVKQDILNGGAATFLIAANAVGSALLFGTNGAVTRVKIESSGAVSINEIATPAAPSLGFNEIYFKSDKVLYVQKNDGTEYPIYSINHLFTINTKIPDGMSVVISRYNEVTSGFTLELGLDADLEIL